MGKEDCMKQAVVCVSFGTLQERGRADLEAVETVLQRTAGDRPFVRAYRNAAVRAALAARGIEVPSLPQALGMLAEQGCEAVAVQPTHLLYGGEYDKVRADTEPWKGRFASLKLGEPLLAGVEDLRQAAQAVAERWPARLGEALILMGHGTPQFAGVAYPALQSTFALQGRPDVFVGAMHGWPALEQLLPLVRAQGYRAVHLAPFLLVAGSHACRNMAGDDPASWKSRARVQGFAVRCTLEGLGRLPQIRQMYAAKLEKMLEER